MYHLSYIMSSSICRLSKLKSSVKNHIEKWRGVYYSNTPDAESFPQPLDKLSDLERLLVLRCIRPDRLVPAVRSFVVSNMSKRYIEPASFNLLESWKDSTSVTPLILILTPGSDPMANLLKFAESQGKDKTIQIISLGQGQVI